MNRTATLLTLVVAAVTASSTRAQPSLNLVDNGNASFTLQVVTDASGPIATEIATEEGGLVGTGNLTFTNVILADPAIFDVENLGHNPFTDTVTCGLNLDNISTNEIFASFGTGSLGVGVFDFLTVEFRGTGTIDAYGILAQQGVNHSVFTSSDVTDVILGDFNGDIRVDGGDFLQWQYDEVSGPPSAVDLAFWEANYGAPFIGSASFAAVPEPSTLTALLVGIFFSRRQRTICGPVSTAG
ncbi:hypothetical protein [Adhaeretor mobilis]|uniref:PEP-CTERM protein-sorting domain-containing protein n=1 Tax=Adhaeretor mobilis TaxID=1930276 RepID=A0A517MUU3_9BACT|nr:hypothetical protein [Adhaeretor mobilis]QDS98653.1 hypothetical protein HG15A2_19340 [Adhaeretor mobilis]